MLSSKEKINELRSIISEQENKIHFLDLVSQKFINTMNHDGKIDINKLLNQMENSKELYQKINQLQKENNNLKMEINEQNNYINNLNNEQTNKTNNNNELNEFKADLITMLDNSIRNTEGSPMQNELIKIYKYINSTSKNENIINKINNNINNNNISNNININRINNEVNNDNIKKSYFDDKININIIKKNNNNIDILNNNINNYNIKNINNNNIMNNVIIHKKSMSSANTNKYNSIKGITFTPYIQKSNNKPKNNIDNNFNQLNHNENINNLQYLSEKNRINDPRLKNKKYINKFINININND